ncbi:MAG: diguanylate cyclase, partial [Phycisphaerales bacterium]|nr:diguanylate cyclase [Phycisphaerales bacterium]
RALIMKQMRAAGYEVIPCENGREAIDRLKEIGSGIVVADWEMPDMDGLECCRAVRELCELQVLGQVYFILLSANHEKEQVVLGFDAGADDFVVKPHHQQELIARVKAGERLLGLQNELVSRQREVAKINAEVVILNRRLEKLANTDGLTGVWNRRYAFEQLQRTWSLSLRHDRPLSVIMLDVDRFKKVNDTHGHKAGDGVLVLVSAILSRQIRDEDFCGRFGGEEFLVVCPETELPEAVQLAERLRSVIEACPVPIDGGELTVTISLGVAQRFGRHGQPEDLIAEADELLYRAKQNGRNQVWMATADRTGGPYGHALAVAAGAAELDPGAAI